MGSYSDLIESYRGITQRNAAKKQQQEADFWNSLNSLAGSLQKVQLDKLANVEMNRMDPPRAAAVNPNAPGVAEANAIYGGPTAPHRGGVAELQMLRTSGGDRLNQEMNDSRRLMLDERLRMETEMAARKSERAIPAPQRVQPQASLPVARPSIADLVGRPSSLDEAPVSMDGLAEETTAIMQPQSATQPPPQGVKRGKYQGVWYVWDGTQYVKEL